MSFIQCSCDCVYQKEGYCSLEKAAEITNTAKNSGCLHYIASDTGASKQQSAQKQPS